MSRDNNIFETFMNPRSVAIIGAGRKTGKGSFNLVENLLAFGFQGRIYPVNPFAREIFGIGSYRDVRDIREPVDLAVISTPREEIPQIVRHCASCGIKGAIIVPQGFADADQRGKELQGELTRAALECGIRLLGPNTLGVSNPFTGFSSSFMPLRREKAPVGIICQSGIFFVGYSSFSGLMGKGIDIGNGCDLDFADALDYFGEDDETRIIFMHIEGLVSGTRLLEAARRVARHKPVIALKTARSEKGARAAASHSGALAGKSRVVEAALKQAGVITVRTSEEISDLVKTLLHLPPMAGNRVGVITFTGAGGIILIDAFEDYGLEPAVFSAGTLEAIRALSPDWMPIGNPMDIWPALMKHGLNHVYEVALEAVMRDPGVDAVICIAIAPDLPENDFLDATGTIRKIAASYPLKPVVAWLYGPNQAAVSAELEKGGRVISFSSLPRAARALAALYDQGGRVEGKP